MYESENFEALLPEDSDENHLTTLNKSALQQYKLSLQRSNNTSNILLEDVWTINSERFNKQAVDTILKSAQELLKNVDTSQRKAWKSSLGEKPDKNMYESENFEALLPEDSDENHLTTLNKSALSLQRSNNTSNILLEDVWTINSERFNKQAVDTILRSAQELLKNVDTSQRKAWKSSLGNFKDHKELLQKSSPSCNNCYEMPNQHTLEDFFKNECKCDLGKKDLNRKPVQQSTSKSIFVKNLDNTSQESKDEDDKVYKSKLSQQRPFNRASSKNILLEPKTKSEPIFVPDYKCSPLEKLPTETNFDKEEEENKAHKSNVAKITFKTAKEQLLASNPAAKRTLGASRKAQGKFVSPMIGAQDKQETVEPSLTDERLKHLDPKMIELIESEIIDKGTPIGWDDIAGLQMAKSVIQEAVVWPLLRPDIFTGLRRPPKGILLFGPPGTGKTLIGKCVAAQCNATFFSISASSLTSKWIGDGEKMVRALFAVARCHQPAVIFIDEIDSLLTQRSDSEHEATRRIKTEFLVQFDGAATGEEDRLLIVGATNRPQELDEAARRRLVKRLYIPLPDVEARSQIITNLLQSENNEISSGEIAEIARRTEGFSGADVRALCAEAAMGPVRAVPLAHITTIHLDSVRPVCAQDFINALQRVRPSVSQDDLGQYVKWNQTYGHGF